MKKFGQNSLVTVVAISVALVASPLAALAAGPAAVNLGASGSFAILTKTGISTTGATSVIGDIGSSPAAASYITGFGLTLPAAGAFSTSALINGKVYAPGYANPTSANLTTAVLDMQNAYTDAAGRAPTVTELGAGNIGGLTLAPGVYKWGTGLSISTDVTLSGGANDVWIFQVAGNLNISSAQKVVLSGGAQASNIFWVVAGQTTLGTTSVFNGTILDQTSIVLQTGATLNGRALAQSAVTLEASVVTVPSPAAGGVDPTPGPVMCTMDAKLCSDGSYVARTGPSCEFAACPVVASPSPAPTQQPASTDARVALQAQLNSLLATLQSLQAQAVQRGSSAPASGQQIRAIATDLTVGSRGTDVSVLQQFLISQGRGSAAQTLAGNGATTYFGNLTRAALAEFQASVGITPASGYFGARTRAYVNSSSY